MSPLYTAPNFAGGLIPILKISIPDPKAEEKVLRAETNETILLFIALTIFTLACAYGLIALGVDEKVTTAICAVIAFVPTKWHELHLRTRKIRQNPEQTWDIQTDYRTPRWIVALRFALAYECLSRASMGLYATFFSWSLDQEFSLQYEVLYKTTQTAAAAVALFLFPALAIYLARNAAYQLESRKYAWICGAIFLSTALGGVLNKIMFLMGNRMNALPFPADFALTVLTTLLACSVFACLAAIGVYWSVKTDNFYQINQLFKKLPSEKQGLLVTRAKLEAGLAKRSKI